MSVLTGKAFFPRLISQPFHHGLVIVFSMAIAVLLIAAAASAFRGGRYVREEEDAALAASIAAGAATTGAGTDIVSDEIAAQEADHAQETDHRSLRTPGGQRSSDD